MCDILNLLIQARVIKGGRDYSAAGKAVECLENHKSWNKMVKLLRMDDRLFNQQIRGVVKRVKYEEWFSKTPNRNKIYPNRNKAVKGVLLPRPDEQIGGAITNNNEQQESAVNLSANQSKHIQDFLDDVEFCGKNDVSIEGNNKKMCQILSRYNKLNTGKKIKSVAGIKNNYRF